MYIGLAIVVAIILIDLIPQINLIYSRIGIGRFLNTNAWITKVQKKSIDWLRKTPTIKLTDHNRLIIIDIFKGNYKRQSIQHWQEASLILGLVASYNHQADQKVKNEIDSYLARKINKDGQWAELPKEIDSIILAYAIMKINWIDHDFIKPAMDYSLSVINTLVGEDGTVAYKKHNTSFRFVDTIGFICPFLMVYGIKYNNENSIRLSAKQISEFNKHGMLNDSYIPCHTYSMDSHLPVGLFGWGRGLGWYAIGLIDAWNELPHDHSEKVKLTQSVYHFAKMAIQFQNDNGSWNWLITHKKSISDSSTTATLAWFLSNITEDFDIYPTCISAKEKALNYLMKNTRKSGAVDFSQGDTKGIGIHSQNFDILPFTQGFTLRTYYKD